MNLANAHVIVIFLVIAQSFTTNGFERKKRLTKPDCSEVDAKLKKIMNLLNMTLRNKNGKPMKPAFKTLNVCEGSSTCIKCDKHHKLQIKSAIYGRTDRSVCPDPRIMTLKCQSNTSDTIIKSKCNGKRTCCFQANNWDLGGDPCMYTYKYLAVEYTCS